MKINLIVFAFLLTAACSSPSDRPDAAQEKAPASRQRQTASDDRPDEKSVPENRQTSEPLPPQERTVRFVPPVIVDEEEGPPVIDDRWEDANVATMDGDYWPPEPEIVVAVQEPEIYEIVDEYAEFPGGINALRKYLRDNLVYPASAKEQGIQGKCFLKFVVAASGNISNVKVMRGVPECPECDNEAVRVLKAMPDWKPGKVKGQAVNSYFNLPISFHLANE
jgi:protein TonB